MKKTFFLGITLFLFIQNILAQDSVLDLVYWSDKKLSWNDFEYITQDSLNEQEGGFTFKKASSNLTVHYCVFGNSEEHPVFIIFNTFNKKKSYTVDTISEELLKHEQLHFDINELYVRLILKEIKALQSQKEKNIDLYTAKIDSLLNQRKEMQQKYDEETLHGQFQEEQIKWNNLIKIQLYNLEEYSVNYRKQEFCY